MNTDQPTPFGAGPRLADAPIGDPSREAVASLRGYAYQLYASALAWVDLQSGEELYLEVAEDYSVAATGALQAVQVKDTGPTSVTINSDGVRDAIESFVNLVELNPRRLIYFRYLTTSPIGLERATEDRAAAKPTLEYWRQAATSADVSPLRQVLLATGFSPRVQQYINDRDDQTLRDQLLKRIQWDCGQPPLQAVQEELTIRLGKYAAENLGLSADEGRQLTGIVIKQILDTVVREKPRRLSVDELGRALDDATSMRVPRRIGNALLEAAFNQMTGQTAAVSGGALVPRVLEAETDRPMPPILADRRALIDDVVTRARNYGIATINGGSGKGKTIVARLAARTLGGSWHIVDLRNASAAETIPHLDQASLEVPTARPAGLILDDLNEIDDPAARRALIRILAAARRNDVTCLLTAYNQPSARSLSDLGIAADACIAVPDLTVDEVKEMIVLAGGDARWGQTIHIAGAFGHPQLVSALISGLRSRSWPIDELRGLRQFEKSDDVEAERLAARRQLVAAVPEDAKALLYRVSMVIGRFERQTVLSLAQLAPTIQSPGQQLDLLIGPWVEQYAKQQLRVSPLLANAGQEMLATDEQVAVHRAVAEEYTGKPTLDVGQADSAFLHGLLGKSESALTRLAFSILFADQAVRPTLSEWITGVRLHRKDRPIFPTSMRVSVLLRIAQMLLLANGKRQPDDIETCWNALQREIASAPEKVKSNLEMMALGKLLSDFKMAALLPDWVGQIPRLVEYLEKNKRLVAELKRPVPGIESPTLAGMLFLIQVAGLDSVAALKMVFDRLDSLSKTSRDKLLADAAAMPSDFSLFVSHPWLAEHTRGSIDWRTCADLYFQMSQLAQKWGIRSLALRCHIARGVMLDEYAQEPDQALEALNEAERRLGTDPALSRARAKIYYRRKDHAHALALLRDSAEKTARNDYVEQAFMFREAGVSAAETGDWTEATRWFGAAHQAAAKVSSESMGLMTTGLVADQGVAAFQSGDLRTALALLSAALTELSKIDHASSIKAGYCHRVIRHAVLCINVRTSGKREMLKDQQLTIAPGMCSNQEPTDIKDLPLGHIDIAWYLLAEAEIAGNTGSAINDALRAKLGGKAIASLEVTLREAHTAASIRAVNPQQLVAHLQNWIEANLHVQAMGTSFRQFSAEKPTYGEIEKATVAQLNSQTTHFVAADTLLAFGISAGLQARPDALKELSNLIAQADVVASLKELAACMAGDLEKRDHLEGQLAANIFRAAQQGTNLQPDEVFVAALQFIQRIAISNLKYHLAPLLAGWLRARWSHALAEQTVLLRNPASNRLAIEQVIAMNDNSVAYCAHFLMTVAPAATSRLRESFRQYLTNLAQQV